MKPERLREIRKKLAMTQPELGRALGLAGKTPGHTVRMWETGKRSITGPIARCVLYLMQTRTIYCDTVKNVDSHLGQRGGFFFVVLERPGDRSAD